MKIDALQLRDMVREIFLAAGSSAFEAERVAYYLVEANLVGHDSHGVIRVAQYVGWVRQGKLLPNRKPEIVSETDVTALVDGGSGFGQVMGEAAMSLGISKARDKGIAIVGLRNSGHLGRIGDWAETAAGADLISLHYVNTSGGGILVAPHGGTRRRLSANPIAAGVPVRGMPPIILDISTCTIAEGKVKVALNKGLQVPEGCLLDCEGRPTTDPRALYADPPGAILPLGGHKGFGLSVVVEMLAGALTGGWCSNPDADRVVNNMLTILIDPTVFVTEEAFTVEAVRFLEHVLDCPTSEPGGEILTPGEPERRTKATRLENGISLDHVTWSQLTETAASLGVEVPAV